MTKYDAIKVLKNHKICFEHDFGWNKQVLDALDVAIETLADVAPVRHGKWNMKFIDDSSSRFYGLFRFTCSFCGYFENKIYSDSMDNVNYCPNCGAKMEVEK